MRFKGDSRSLRKPSFSQSENHSKDWTTHPRFERSTSPLEALSIRGYSSFSVSLARLQSSFASWRPAHAKLCALALSQAFVPRALHSSLRFKYARPTCVVRHEASTYHHRSRALRRAPRCTPCETCPMPVDDHWQRLDDHDEEASGNLVA